MVLNPTLVVSLQVIERSTILGAKLGNIFALLRAFIGLSLTQESYRFSTGEHRGDGRSGNISRRPVLALTSLLVRNRQGAVGDCSLIHPSAVWEPCPSSARLHTHTHTGTHSTHLTPETLPTSS